MLLSLYILAPTISLKKCQFSCYYLYIYQLQQLALKNVNFHVTISLYTSSNNQPKKCPFSCYYGLGISLHLATLSTISLYTSSNIQDKKCRFSHYQGLGVSLCLATLSTPRYVDKVLHRAWTWKGLQDKRKYQVNSIMKMDTF